MRQWIAPLFRTRRAVSNGGLLLSGAYDLTCFIQFFELYTLCFKCASMRLLIAPSFRSRRSVSNGGPHLSVAYNLTCFIKFFIWQILLKICIYEAVDSTMIHCHAMSTGGSSFVCSLWLDLFYHVFCSIINSGQSVVQAWSKLGLNLIQACSKLGLSLL
mgnify:CR=1 FL=1